VPITAVQSALASLIASIKPNGCTTCGLIGIDLLIRGGDPVFYNAVSKLRTNANVMSISETGVTIG
jgi:hypothetical protein